MGVYQDLEGVGDLGSVRSARDYYVSLALGHDAIYIHAGGSPQAYSAFLAAGPIHIGHILAVDVLFNPIPVRLSVIRQGGRDPGRNGLSE